MSLRHELQVYIVSHGQGLLLEAGGLHAGGDAGRRPSGEIWVCRVSNALGRILEVGALRKALKGLGKGVLVGLG